MNTFINSLLMVSFLAVGILGCATGYSSKGLGGGYNETRLSEDSYQVRFNGNGFTSEARTSQFVLRRCAEITLEQGKRYFTLLSSQTGSAVYGTAQGVHSFPSGQAMMKVLDNKEENCLDAVIIIEETDDEAKGRLSPEAAKTLQAIKL